MVWPSLKFVTLGLAAPFDIAHPGEIDEFIHPQDVSRRQVCHFDRHCHRIQPDVPWRSSRLQGDTFKYATAALKSRRIWPPERPSARSQASLTCTAVGQTAFLKVQLSGAAGTAMGTSLPHTAVLLPSWLPQELLRPR